MRIRKARSSDLEAVVRISRECRFEVGRDWKGILSSKDTEMFLLLDGDDVAGFTGLIRHDWNGTLQILNLFILPEYRGRGLGPYAVNFLINKARKMKYRCLIAEAPSTNPVLMLYKKAGFRKCGYNDRYYSNGGDEIAIWLSLDLK